MYPNVFQIFHNYSAKICIVYQFASPTIKEKKYIFAFTICMVNSKTINYFQINKQTTYLKNLTPEFKIQNLKYDDYYSEIFNNIL